MNVRPYLLTTGILFGLLTIVHLWRVVAESASLARDPWYLLITALAAAFCVWALALYRRTARVG
jgi:hypothetical protein